MSKYVPPIWPWNKGRSRYKQSTAWLTFKHKQADKKPIKILIAIIKAVNFLITPNCYKNITSPTHVPNKTAEKPTIFTDSKRWGSSQSFKVHDLKQISQKTNRNSSKSGSKHKIKNEEKGQIKSLAKASNEDEERQQANLFHFLHKGGYT